MRGPGTYFLSISLSACMVFYGCLAKYRVSVRPLHLWGSVRPSNQKTSKSGPDCMHCVQFSRPDLVCASHVCRPNDNNFRHVLSRYDHPLPSYDVQIMISWPWCLLTLNVCYILWARIQPIHHFEQPVISFTWETLKHVAILWSGKDAVSSVCVSNMYMQFSNVFKTKML